MAIALNFTVPLKQDPQSQESLRHLVASFAQDVQPALDAALSRSQIVHFARILVIDNRYLQVLTEFDGDPMDYTEFFRKQLGPVFQAIFALAEGAPPWDELNNPNSFYEYTRDSQPPVAGHLDRRQRGSRLPVLGGGGHHRPRAPGGPSPQRFSPGRVSPGPGLTGAGPRSSGRGGPSARGNR